MDDTKQLVAFFHFLEKMKKLERFKDNVFWRDYHWIERFDSNADHTWRMAMILVVIEKRLEQPIDLARALKLVLVHDLPEIIAGDLSPLGSDGTGRDSHRFNEAKRKEKTEREEAAMREIATMLPGEEGEELFDLWREYEDQETYESKVVKAVDKVEARMQAVEYTDAHIYPEHLEPMTEMNREFIHEPILKAIDDEVIQYIKAHFTEFANEERIVTH